MQDQEMRERSHSNLKRAIVALLVPLPSILFYLSFLRHYDQVENPNSHLLWSWCYHHPILLVNSLFFLNVNVLFWLIGHIQSSHWMIDPYWTVIPTMMVHYYATHPLLASSSYNVGRSRVVITLTWLWCVRLLHNYFRREKWQWGAREDWRFFDMRHQYGNRWWWVSFFAIYAAQQFFLIGVTIPFYIIHAVDKPWGVWDLFAILVCVSGIVIAYKADTQLHEYVSMNEKLKQQGEPMVPTLETGMWRYSRHPNYFGEQLWWWGLTIFALSLGYGWAFFGALLNTMCLAYVTILVEDRMLNQPYRAEAYKLYQKTTSIWIPWFNSNPEPAKQKSA